MKQSPPDNSENLHTFNYYGVTNNSGHGNPQFSPAGTLNLQGSHPNQAAVVAFIASISSLIVLWMLPFIGVIASIVGIMFGHKAMDVAKYTGNGRGLGVSAVVIGYASLLNAIIVTGFVLFLMLPS